MSIKLTLIAGAAFIGVGITPAAAEVGVSNSVVLRNAQASANIARLPILRSYDLATLRSRPVVMLGGNQVSMKPLLENPHALLNVAARLQAMPKSVSVTINRTQTIEVAQGLIVHQELAYSILPGQCTNAAGRSAIEASGVHCLTRPSLSARLASFSQRNDPHFIADAGKRATVMARYRSYYSQQQSMIDQHIAEFRKALADPTKHAQAVAKIGAAKVAQIGAMSDDQLKDEMANTAAHHIQETLFVPRNPTGVTPLEISRLGAVPTATSKPSLPNKIAASAPVDQDLPPVIYLTGFTFGNTYEWSDEIDVTVDPCSIGLDILTDGLTALFGISACPIHASVTPYAGLNYGFGLRFPIKTNLHYHREIRPDKTAQASVTATYQPINGAVADYASAGLDPTKIFDGKELVAQVGANAGFRYDLPIVGSDDVGFSLEKDFTTRLPSPFTNGQFTPPAPGPSGLDGAPIVFDQFDLLGDVANFGFAGAQVFPAIKVGLVSNGLTFALTDKARSASGSVTKVARSGQTVPIGVGGAPGYTTDFTFGDPLYNLAFLITPGIDPHIFVDLAIWSDSWDPQIWFPQLAVQLPPGGVTFSCHEGTVCTREYTQSGVAAVQAGSSTVAAPLDTMVSASIHFHGNGDGKDDTTVVDLGLDDQNGNRVASIHIPQGTRYPDNGDTSEYPFVIANPNVTRDMIQRGYFDINLPYVKGNDTWNYTAYLTVRFRSSPPLTGQLRDSVSDTNTHHHTHLCQFFVGKGKSGCDVGQ